MSPQRLPHELWKQAQREHPDDREAHAKRYVELMRESGHIVPKRDQAPVRLRGPAPTEETR